MASRTFRGLGLGLVLVGLVLVGCVAPRSPFPILGPLSDDEIIAVLRGRYFDVESLYAEVEMTYDGPAFRGTFDSVLHFRAPGLYRLTAFKDIVFAVEPVFDLILNGEEYGLEVAQRGDDPPILDRGPVEKIGERHGDFAGFYWVGEAFFAPGCLRLPARVRVIRDGRLGETLLESELDSGARVTWRMTADTLEVVSATVVTPSGESYHLEYSDYRIVEGMFFPGWVRFEAPAGGIVLQTVLEEIELNPALDDEMFDAATVGLGGG